MIIGEEWFRIARESHSHVAGKKLLNPFFLEGSRQLKLILVSFPFQGAEWGWLMIFETVLFP